jgi:nicotinamidase-related amidase
MFSPEESILLIIDVQGRLARLMYRKEEMSLNLTRLIQAAHQLAIPIIYTEQVPEKLGQTIPVVAELLKKMDPIPKASFSCLGEEKFALALRRLKRPCVVAAGMEMILCEFIKTARHPKFKEIAGLIK